jgi:predicted permease
VTHGIADLRYTLRRLRARPTYSLLVTLTLGLGIGGTAAVFAIARPLLFEPLPYRASSELVSFWLPGYWTEAEFLYLRGSFDGFSSVAAYRPGDLTLRVGDGLRRLIPGLATSAELFTTLGATPALGRTFASGDDARGAEPVVVISHRLWRELGGGESIVGRRLVLDGAPRTVIGVMPPTFWFPTPDVDLWHPRALDPLDENGSYALIGRLAAGRTEASMPGALARIGNRLRGRFQYPVGFDKAEHPTLVSLRDSLLGAVRPALVAMLVAMGAILLIAGANVAALMLGQIEGRATELAVRRALGAGRQRLTQQLVIEALVLGFSAAALGSGLGVIGLPLIARGLPIGAWTERTTLDWTLFAAAFVLAVGAALCIVVVPLVALVRGEVAAALGRSRTGGVAGRGGRLEQGLVVAEVALAMVIAVGTGLLVRSVAKLYAIEPGIETSGIAVADVVLDPAEPDAARTGTIRDLVHAASLVPGVAKAGATIWLPMRHAANDFGITIEGRPERQSTFTFFRLVSIGYFDTMGMKIRSGRSFDPSDQGGGERTVVINEALARRYFPGENPIGRRIGGGFAGWERIVGVVNDVTEGSLTGGFRPTRYYLADQVPWLGNQVTVVAHGAPGVDPTALVDRLRSALDGAVPSVSIQATTTMNRVRAAAVGPARQVMTLLALLAGIALVLGAVGLYGVLSHFIARRRRDWAIRLALGLSGARIQRSVVGQGVALVLLGMILGIGGALLVGRLLASFLFNVASFDPLAIGLAGCTLLLAGVLATLLPARRAGTVDPARVLREQ